MKKRLDVLLVERGLAQTRSQAQALVLAGRVPGHTKAGEQIDEGAELEVEAGPRFVSRGGEKLAHALDELDVDVAGEDVLDVGASTGGFTDVLLQRGARAVCAVDVGHNQLAWRLRQDPRVTSIEGLNARHLELDQLPFAPEIVVCDVSFISLALVLPRLAVVAAPRGRFIVCLVKPQFEVGKGEVGKGGVVRDEAKRLAVLERVAEVARGLGCAEIGRCESPITGPAGNVEYLLALRPSVGEV
jgi:23S rRNA (cytidine1920-2'-O)/16S rRNA (cytidine1409-2'-O)-methyltransferase